MTPMDKFLAVNSLRKADLARYLGIHPSNITLYCTGAKPVPPLQMSRIIGNNQGWDTTMLTDDGRPEKDNSVSVLRSELELLHKEVNTLTMMVASYEAILKTFLKDGLQG